MADNLTDLTDLIAAALGDKIMHTNGSGDRNRAYAAHVALVVEQHANGRIAELEAAIARVEKLEAEYTRDDQEHLNTFGQHHPVAGIAHDHLRAALEGEQQ